MSDDNLALELKELLPKLLTNLAEIGAVEAEKSTLYKEIFDKDDLFKSAEYFYLFVVAQHNTIFKRAVQNKLTPPKENVSKITTIFLNHNFINAHLRAIFEKYEGSCCCADKSKSLINQFIRFNMTGVYPDWSVDSKTFWIPKFGNQILWFDFIESLISLYFGKPDLYLNKYAEITALGEVRREELLASNK